MGLRCEEGLCFSVKRRGAEVWRGEVWRERCEEASVRSQRFAEERCVKRQERLAQRLRDGESLFDNFSIRV